MKVVADTNVLVSALVFPGGPPEALYRLALEERIQLVSSRPLLAELGRALTEKFEWSAARVEDAVGELVLIARIVEPKESVSEIVEDPADNRALEAAAEAAADAIVSGDRLLLQLGSWRGVPVVRPAEFLAMLEEG